LGVVGAVVALEFKASLSGTEDDTSRRTVLCLAAPPRLTPAKAERVKIINPELWQACAGPLVNLPPAGTHVVYFPQGHSEQVAASMRKVVDAQIPNYPKLHLPAFLGGGGVDE